ncbi:hypothetical protein [uncultured Brevundimonas sp.]|uniref:hypothetical protein n=1 Tax=uncultured Brevundimonas sp. TaxID=213418 RepID=UPI0030ED07CA|tara:strand:+ start:4396 stop:5250 length:855 start_codon:yes stop_codon:yes gene_type:complete
MLFDAIRAEGYRLTKNRLQLFWSVLLTPLLFAVGGIAFHIFTKSKGDEMAAKVGLTVAAAPVNMAEALAFGANYAANGVLMICVLIAAAGIYAGDYHWETWRLISARNDRMSLILGKVGVVKLTALAATTAFLIASLVFYAAQALVYHRPMTFSLDGAHAGQFGLLWLLAWVRVIQFTLIALLTAVMTRSMMAALFVPWALGFVQSILGQAMGMFGWEPHMWAPLLLLPGLDYDTLKMAIVQGTAPAVPTAESTMRALVGLGLWTAVPLAGALAWFRRQDLSKE